MPIVNRYLIGESVHVVCTFEDVNGAAVDPTAVTAEYEDPAVVKTAVPSPTKAATGVYTFDVSPTLAGTWYTRFEGTGANQGAAESSFVVDVSRFYP